MDFSNIDQKLKSVLKANLDASTDEWIHSKLNDIIATDSAKDLYMTYSLLAGKVDTEKKLLLDVEDDVLKTYLETQNADALEIARIYLLVEVLGANNAFFQTKVANLIQVADTGELVTFLKYLILLPDAGKYKQTAVEALRTNIASVFEAISMKNPYPAIYFNDQQWNQMYLKAAFMQLDLSKILDVDKRANRDLARIISDYAHERWAASRDIDPMFWRPVSGFLNGNLIADMKRLLQSDNMAENKAGALCCYYSDSTEAKELLEKYTDLHEQVRDDQVTWENLNY